MYGGRIGDCRRHRNRKKKKSGRKESLQWEIVLPPHSERLEWNLVRFAKQRTLSQIWDRPVIIRNRIYLVQFETTTSFFLRFRSRQIAYAYSLRTWLPMARAPIHLSASRVIFWVCVLPTACFLYAFQTCWCKPNMIVTSCMKLCGYLCAVDAKNEPISTMCLQCWNSNFDYRYAK